MTEGHRHWILATVLWKNSPWQWNSRKNTSGKKEEEQTGISKQCLKEQLENKPAVIYSDSLYWGRAHTKLLCFICTFIFWNPIHNKGKRCQELCKSFDLAPKSAFPQRGNHSHPTSTSTLKLLNGFKEGRNQTHWSKTAAVSSCAQRRHFEGLYQIALIETHC